MAEETRGVFTLKTVRNNILNNEYVTPDQAFSAGSTESPNVGYYAGGQNPSQTPAIVSTVDKTNFDTDTTAFSPSSNLAVNHQIHGSFSSISAGYFGGGGNPSSPGSSSQVQKLSYFSETTSISPGSNLTQSRGYPTGCSNTQNGYFIGGYIFPTAYTTAEKLSFSTDTPYFLPTAVFTTARYGGASAGNQSVAYFAGGIGPSGNAYDSLIDKLTYSTDTTARLPDDLTRRRIYPAGVGNADAGFFAGGTSYTGAVPGPTAYVSDIDKLTYSNETVSANPSNLSVARASIGSAGNTTSGYYAGGNPGPVSTMDKITFSTGSVSAVTGAALSLARYVLAGASPRSNAFPTTGYLANTENLKGQSDPNTGYTGGGYNGSGAISTVNKLYFATDSMGSVPANYSIARYYVAGTGSLTAGYGGGGRGGVYSTMDKTTYSTDTTVVAIPAATLSSARYGCSALGTKEFGYFSGGTQAPPNVSLTDRITYAIDLRALVPGANLTEAGNFQSDGGSGNQSTGYVAGFPGTQTKIDRLDYSTETFSTVSNAQLTSQRPFLVAVSNSSAGYYAGGYTGPQYSTVDKLDFSTETLSASFPMISNRSHSSGAGNESNAYIIGSQQPGLSSIEKISYTTDSPSLIPGANTPTSTLAGAAGNSAASQGGLLKKVATLTLNSSIPGTVPNTGYLGGLLAGGPQRSEVQKIDFTTETTSTPTNRSQNAGFSGGNSSATAAYFGGGSSSGPVPYSTMDKLTYSNDSLAAVPGANLTQARYLFGGQVAGDSTKALWAGGYRTPTTYYNLTDKLIFSSDTTAAVPGAALSATKYGITANASPSAGYVAGGSTGGGNRRTDIDKINMSTETTSRMPSGDLPSTRTYAAGISYPRAGYFAGGSTPSAISEVMKINFASDTLERIQNFPTTIIGTTATGNQDAAYISGGQTPSYTSATQKLEYSTDTFTRSAADIPVASGYSAGASARSQGGRYTSNVL